MTYTMPSNVTTWMKMIVWTNTTVDYWFGNAILAAFFVVVFLVTKKAETKKAFAAAGFMTALIGVMMRTLELVSDTAVIMAIVAAAAGLFWLIVDNK